MNVRRRPPGPRLWRVAQPPSAVSKRLVTAIGVGCNTVTLPRGDVSTNALEGSLSRVANCWLLFAVTHSPKSVTCQPQSVTNDVRSVTNEFGAVTKYPTSVTRYRQDYYTKPAIYRVFSSCT